MSVIIVLIIVSLLIATVFLFFFLWAIHSGQYDDTHTPSVRMLWDDEKSKPAAKP